MRLGFHQKMKLFWDDIQRNDPTFGARPTKMSPPDDYGVRVRAAVCEGKMDPTGNVKPYDLLALFACVLGTMFGFRGVKEYYDLRLDHLEFGEWPRDTPGVGGMKYLGIKGNLTHKTHQLSLQNPTIYNDKDARRVVYNPADPISPFKLARKIMTMVHPDQVYVFHTTLSESQLKTGRAMGVPKSVRYNLGRRMGLLTISRVRLFSALIPFQ